MFSYEMLEFFLRFQLDFPNCHIEKIFNHNEDFQTIFNLFNNILQQIFLNFNIVIIVENFSLKVRNFSK